VHLRIEAAQQARAVNQRATEPACAINGVAKGAQDTQTGSVVVLSLDHTNMFCCPGPPHLNRNVVSSF